MEPTRLPALVLRVALLVLALSPALSRNSPSSAASGTTNASFGCFLPNAGQVVDVDGNRRREIRYVAHTRGMSLYLADSRISYVFTRMNGDLEHYRGSDGHAAGHHGDGDSEVMRELYRIDLELIGALPSPEIIAELPSADYTNYYLPHIPAGITGVRSYSRLLYRNIYPKIDFMIESSGDRLKYDFIVHPGGRLSDIRMRYAGATGSGIERNGALVTTTPLGNLREDAPYTYQERSSKGKGTRRTIPSAYRLAGDTISFLAGAYDSTRTLVIDPTQKWSTFYGGAGIENLFGGDASEVDRSGNVFFTGTTSSSTFPTSPGAFQSSVTDDLDIVVVKMSITGKRLWATIYGGSDTELSHGVATDRHRNVFVAGHTVSDDFPTYRAFDRTLGGIRDAYVLKFDSNGVRQWATYYGGDGFDDSYGFAIDSTGNPALVGTTESAGGEMATPGAFQEIYGGGENDVFLVKFSAAGERLWGTYYGGSQSEQGHGAATDIHDNINITGWTNSMDFPVTAGAFQTRLGGDYDAFVVRLNSSGKRQWGTYFGGTDTENDEEDVGVGSIATDGDGNPVITGVTRSRDLPTSPGALQPAFGGVRDAFIAMFDNAGHRRWSTYVGGSRDDAGQGIASNQSNSVLVTGHTYSRNFPGITDDAFSRIQSGGADAFVVKIDSSGAYREYVTFYGGTGDDFGLGISFDPFGSIVVAGNTGSVDFPTTAGAFAEKYSGSMDVFVALFCDMGPVALTADGPTRFCHGDSVTLTAPAGYSSYLWTNGSDMEVARSRSITVGEKDHYRVRVTNGAGCTAWSEPVAVDWTERPEPVVVSADGRASFCDGDSVTLVATGGDGTIYWSNGSTGRSITVKESGTYTAWIVDAHTGCTSVASQPVVVFVSMMPVVTITAAPSARICAGGTTTLDAGSFAVYRWSDSSGNILGTTRTLDVTSPGVYFVDVENEFGCAARSRGIAITSVPAPVPVITVDGAISRVCNDGRPIVLRASTHSSYRWSDANGNLLGSADTLSVGRPGLYTLIVEDGACSGTASITIEGAAPIVPTTSTSGTARLCPGDSLVITADAGYSRYQWRRDGSDLPGENRRELIVRTGGHYSVRVTEAGGCTGVSASTDVVVNPGAATPIIHPVEDGLASTPAARYQWSRNGVDIPGGTGPVLRNPGSGHFAVTITDANGCRATSAIHSSAGLASSTVGIHEYAAAPGERISIPLVLTRSQNLLQTEARGFTARIRFNSSMLHPVGGFLSESIDGNDAILTVGGTLPAGFDGDSSVLVSVDFVALLGNAFATPLVVEMFEWDRPGIEVTTFDGLFRTSDICLDGSRQIAVAGMTQLKAPVPNPAYGMTRIEFEVEEEGRTEVSLVDLNGRRVQVIELMLEPGTHTATFDTSELSSGTYICILRTPSQQRAQSMTVRK